MVHSPKLVTEPPCRGEIPKRRSIRLVSAERDDLDWSFVDDERPNATLAWIDSKNLTTIVSWFGRSGFCIGPQHNNSCRSNDIEKGGNTEHIEGTEYVIRIDKIALVDLNYYYNMNSTNAFALFSKKRTPFASPSSQDSITANTPPQDTIYSFRCGISCGCDPERCSISLSSGYKLSKQMYRLSRSSY
jgi:hypothetical protein